MWQGKEGGGSQITVSEGTPSNIPYVFLTVLCSVVWSPNQKVQMRNYLHESWREKSKPAITGGHLAAGSWRNGQFLNKHEFWSLLAVHSLLFSYCLTSNNVHFTLLQVFYFDSACLRFLFSDCKTINFSFSSMFGVLCPNDKQKLATEEVS